MKEKTKGKQVWRKYFSMLRGSRLPWGLMAVCFALSLLSSVMNLAMSSGTGKVLQEGVDVHEVLPDIRKLVVVILALVACSALGKYLQGVLAARVDRNVQKYAVRRIFRLKTADLEERDTRELITRLTDDTAKNSGFLIELAINEFPRLYYIIGAYVSVAAMKQPALLGAMTLLIPVTVILSLISGRISFANRNKVQNRLAEVTAKLAEKIDDIEVIKSYGTEEKETAAGGEVLEELDKVKKEGALVDHVNKFVSNMGWFFDVMIMVIPPTILMFRGAIDRGIYAAYIMIMASFEGAVKEHLKLWIALKEAQGATLRLSELLDLENEETAGGTVKPEEGDIEFRGVSFAYAEDPVLDNVSFTLEKGKKTGIVGLSGSGKSTVLNLIEKFYLPDEGEILLNGKDIRDMDYASYRRMFSYLPQNAPGVSGTVREMLEYSSEREHTDEELENALRDVLLYDDVMALGGLDYDIGRNGENLSGGQRQKLGIARMLLSDSPFVLLDEATSALDPEATAAIQKKIDEKCAGRTLAVVAHDLSTIENADQILVLNRGRVIGRGRHEELVRSLPAYAELAKEV